MIACDSPAKTVKALHNLIVLLKAMLDYDRQAFLTNIHPFRVIHW
jgi:hypothetical protein